MSAALAARRRLLREQAQDPGPVANKIVRAQTVNLRILNDLLRHRIELVGMENKAAADVARAVLRMKRNILRDLGSLRGRGIETLDLGAAQGVLALVNDQLRFLASAVPGALRDEARALAEDEARILSEIGDDAVQAKAPEAPLRFRTPASAAFIELGTNVALGQDVEDIFGKLAGDSRFRIQGALRDIAAAGGGIGDAADAIRGEFDGLRIRAETFARTVMAGAAARSYDEWSAENADVLAGDQYQAVLDDRTCLVCAPDDGLFFAPGEPKPRIPRHLACRCVYSPVVKSADDLGFGADLPAGQRAAMGGEVPDTWTFDRWFAEQDAATQREILGPARYSAWKNGDLPLRGFSAHNRILDLAQLRKRHPRAFPEE